MTQDSRTKRKAALAAVKQMGEGPVVPTQQHLIPNPSFDDLASAVDTAYLVQTVGELLEKARHLRGLGKRELARRLETSHGRIGKLEQSKNLELNSLLEVAQTLGYDISISLIPKDGGTTIQAILKG